MSVLEITGMKCYQCGSGTTRSDQLNEFFEKHQGHVGFWWRVDMLRQHSDAYLDQLSLIPTIDQTGCQTVQ